MSLRRGWRRGGATLVALGLVFAGRWSSQLGAGGHGGPTSSVPGITISSGTVPRGTVPSSHVEAAPAQVPASAFSDASLRATVRPDGEAGGVLVIPVPPAPPERCSPSPIKVDVGQSTLVACRAATYGGPIVANVDNPAIASVNASGGRMMPRYLYVVGIEAGTTVVRVSYQHGPTTSYPITVSRADTSAG